MKIDSDDIVIRSNMILKIITIIIGLLMLGLGFYMHSDRQATEHRLSTIEAKLDRIETEYVPRTEYESTVQRLWLEIDRMANESEHKSKDK